MRLLWVAKPEQIDKNVKQKLEKEYIVDFSFSSSDGIVLSESNEYSVIIIDNELSDMCGTELCSLIRSSNINSPIILIVRSTDNCDKINGINIGADLCIEEPLDLDLLSSYIKSLIRREVDFKNYKSVKIGDLVVDFTKHRVTYGGESIELRRKEYEILSYLAVNENTIISKEKLLENIWNQGILADSNVVEVHIKKIRDKIDRKYGVKLIRTIWNFGYTINKG